MSSPVVVENTALPGVVIVRGAVHRDARGFFTEAFNSRRFAAAGLPTHFVQDNHSRSLHGVLRGMHFQGRQGKLVRVARGAIYDVAVDVRVGSPTFGRWVGATLNDEELKAVWIPPGFAHGFCTLSDTADVVYKCTELYDPAAERGVCWNDPALGIEWPVADPSTSPRDASLPTLAQLADLPAYEP